MVVKRCRSTTSPGITRGFPRLCPTLGLVAVALLTLAPRPLRSVRLACLIHAANVHSEPGSNPSKSFSRASRPQTRSQRLSPLTIASKSSRFRENPRRARNTFSHWSRDHSCPIVGRLSTTSDFASYDAIGEAATPASLKGSFTTQTRSTVLSKSDSRGGLANFGFAKFFNSTRAAGSEVRPGLFGVATADRWLSDWLRSRRFAFCAAAARSKRGVGNTYGRRLVDVAIVSNRFRRRQG